ncbi:MAG: reprolysin-like metallopeptidase [Deltaproteobacteria bacterium]
MNKISLLFLLFFSVSINAQNFWKKIDDRAIISLREADRGIIPEKYSSFSIDITAMAQYLKDIPREFNTNRESKLLYIPMPEGNFMPFDVVDSPVMEQELAEKYPEIRSYRGVSRTDDKINIRFNIGPRGFWGSIYWKGNNIYIDPYADGVWDHCISYYTRDYKVDLGEYNLACGVNEKTILNGNGESADSHFHEAETSERESQDCEPVKQFNYTIAIACTGEWGKKHGNTVASALADIVTSVNRINQIYENEFSIHFNLSAKNDKLVWIDPATDPFENPNAGYGLLPVIGEVINNAIGYNSYDIGHVFTNSCSDVGGVAMLGGVCNALKGNGVTCHYANDLNYIITNVTCHEIGHQFSAVHTFNNCNGNESSSGFEPGGGNSIMAYCGLCGSNNVQYQCTENFHSYSIEQVMNFSRIGGGLGCADKIETENSSPVVSLNYKNGFYIPKSTYFVLEGNAFDCEGDDMTYSWEQMDTGPRTPIGTPVDDSPLFAALEPSTSAVRYFPNIKSIINSNFNNSEILPDYSRNLSFRFIARDNKASSGGTNWADLSFKVDGESGPFRITYPSSAQVFRSGRGVEVKWDIANTNNGKVNCRNVDIYMSADFGYTFPFLLKFRTPNDGSEKVYLPDTLTNIAKFMVKANDNIFFHTDKFGFAVKDPEESSFVFDVDNTNGVFCNPQQIELNITTRSIKNYTDSIRFEVKGLPAGTEYLFENDKIKPGDNSNLKLDFSKSTDDGYFQAAIFAISDTGDTLQRDITWQFYSNNYKNWEILGPSAGSSNVQINPTFNWRKPVAGQIVNFYLSKDPSFPVGSSFIKTAMVDTLIIPDLVLDYASLYYWKLEFINECGTISTDTIYTFSTSSYKCKDYISTDVPVNLNDNQPCISDLSVEDDILISDVNITMKGNHSAFKEIRASLIAPDNTKQLLFNHKSFNYQGGFNLTFDDEAKFKIKTPPSGYFKPDNPLNIFNGKQGNGKWKLEIIDNKDQQSGLLTYFRLELCNEFVPKFPFIVNNNPLRIPLKAYWPISPGDLKISDLDNTDEQLIFTLIRIPVYSDLYHDNIKLSIGDKFSQDDINKGNITIKYDGNQNLIYDRFFFTVTDGEGGWIGITSFNFITDKSISNIEEMFDYQVTVYPNPANNILNILIENEGDFHADIIDMKGQKVISSKINGYVPEIFNISNLNNGIYLLRIRNEKYSHLSKFIKQK